MNGFPGSSRYLQTLRESLAPLCLAWKWSCRLEKRTARLVHATYSSLRTDTAWYSQSLIPIDTFPYIERMDQTASLGELSSNREPRDRSSAAAPTALGNVVIGGSDAFNRTVSRNIWS